MRELKFRVWNNCYNEFIRPDYGLIGFCYPLDGRIAALTTSGEPMEDWAIEQYTGLKDKNGKEIYEGDIIHRGALSKANIFRNSVIRFDKESVGFIATSTRNGARTLFDSYTCDEINVIGNIHENPELLEGKDGKRK